MHNGNDDDAIYKAERGHHDMPHCVFALRISTIHTSEICNGIHYTQTIVYSIQTTPHRVGRVIEWQIPQERRRDYIILYYKRVQFQVHTMDA